MNHIQFTDIKTKAFYAVSNLQAMNRLTKEDKVSPFPSFSMKSSSYNMPKCKQVCYTLIHPFLPSTFPQELWNTRSEGGI
jgi:hypothetical protein